MKRLETGVVTPKDDWPGVFMRGDTALMGYAPAVAAGAEALKETNPIASMQLQSLHKLLMSCQAGATEETQRIVQVEG